MPARTRVSLIGWGARSIPIERIVIRLPGAASTPVRAGWAQRPSVGGGCLVKRSRTSGQITSERAEPALRLVEQQRTSA
jgi:hypothetical protein